MTTLHCINQRPSRTDIWDKLSCAIQANDAVLLIEDACYAALDPDLLDSLFQKLKTAEAQVYILDSDAIARGLASPNQLQ